MNPKPKLSIWIRVALWFLGAVGFCSLVLATLSMFVRICVPISPIRQVERCNVVYFCDIVTFDQGTLSVVKEAFLTSLPETCVAQEKISLIQNQSAFLIHRKSTGSGDFLQISLVGIGLLSLLGFLPVAWKALKIRREAMFVSCRNDDTGNQGN